LRQHIHQLVAADFVVVPTVTGRLLFVLILLAHDRRRIVHVGVTTHPTAEWTAQRVRDAFPWDTVPRFLLHDRDTAFTGLSALGLQEVRTAPRSPWQNAYVERFIGSLRRECLDHVIIFNAAGLRRVLNAYIEYYTSSRTHLALEKDAPVPRPVARHTAGRVVAVLQVGGLHHRYERRAA
jgi:putative transposase